MMHRFRVRIFAHAVRGAFVVYREEEKRVRGRAEKMREDPAEVRKWEKVSPVDGERNVPGENCSRRFISRVTNDTLITVASTPFLKAKLPFPLSNELVT